jgi:phosphodiesterase/alkaline phosphatase D-like protein
MRASLVFAFISIFAISFVAAQSTPVSASSQSPAVSTQDQISNGPVAEYVSDSNATIGWSSRTAGPMTLRYGTDRTKMTQTAEAVEGKDARNHHARLEGLKPNTRYYFVVLSGGEPASGVGTFQTVTKGDTPVTSKAIIPQ